MSDTPTMHQQKLRPIAFAVAVAVAIAALTVALLSVSNAAAQSPPEDAVAPSNTGAPTVSGTAQDGETLNAGPGAWSGSEPIDYAYQWQRCGLGLCNDILGATTQAYALTAADVDSTIRVQVTASNLAGSAGAGSEATSMVAAAPPINTASPTISGTARDGETLNADPGSWSGTEPIDYAYRWRRCDAAGAGCADIAGATGQSHTLDAADAGSTIRVLVTASNAGGSASASSEPTATVAAVPPSNTAPPTISGTARDGETLNADPGAWSGTQPIDYAYQWRTCDGAGASCVDVAGATGQGYELTAGDVGAALRVKVMASNAADSSNAGSEATAAVAAIAPASTAEPTVSGTARHGETLTADRGTWSGTEPIDFDYQWQRCGLGLCNDIAAATEQTYTLTAADVDSNIRIHVSASNAGGAASADSAESVTVAPAAPANTAQPTLSGTARHGETLTADPGTWSGTEPIAFAYQWRRCDGAGADCADIAGATGDSHQLTAGDVDATVRVTVTASNAAGQSSAGSDASAAVGGIAPANTASPTVSGTAADGQTLTADPGSWSGTEPFAYSYQWRRCDADGAGCADVAGATAQSYPLTSADVGSTLRIRVSAVNGAGEADADSEATGAVAAVAPANSAQPTIAGTAEAGQTLSADPGAWSGTQPLAYAYQWQRCGPALCDDIAGADAQSYELGATDVGFTIRLRVTATNAVGSAGAGSEQSATVAPAAGMPINTAAPTIAGSARDGETLTADPGSWSGTEQIAYAYQWRRCDATGVGCADIDGATDQTYALTGADIDATIRVRVTGSNVIGSGSAGSEPTNPVAAAPPSNTAAPTIAGTARDGETLTADPGSWAGTEPIDYSYQWRRCDGAGDACTDIAGATGQSYTLTGSDVDSTLRVQVTGSNIAGQSDAASAPTALVLAAALTNTASPTISGTARDRETLSADPGSWSGTEPISYSYQWRRCDGAGASCADIAGATGQSYTLTAADVGATIRVKVLASNTVGSVGAHSDPTALVAAAGPANVAGPTISGTARDGQALSADPGAWSGTQPIDFAYQWRRCDNTGASCVDISGASGQTYVLTGSDVGFTIRVSVTASNAGGQSGAGSAATAVVVAVVLVNTAPPTISGTARDGETLNASPGTWSGTQPIAYAYRWRRCDSAGASCADIAAATGQTYTLAAADVGFTIRVQVTASNAAGSAGAVSAHTAIIVAAAGAPYRYRVLQDSPRGYWRLDETSGTTAADEAFANNNGAYQGGVSLGAAGALLETPTRAAGFDGSNDMVSFGDPANGHFDMGSGDFTVEAWVNATANGEKAVISKKSSSTRYWLVSVTDDSSHVGEIRVKIHDGTTTRQGYGPAIRVDDGAWHHVAVLFDRDTGIRIYVDGTSALKAGAMAGDVSNSAELRAGAASSYGYFGGRLDEVAIYSGLLSNERIQAHYGGGDTVAPTVTLTSPSGGSTTSDTTPQLAGTAGTAPTDRPSVTATVYSGSQASGTPVRTLTAVPDSNGAWSVETAPSLASGTYTARASQADAAGNTGTSATKTFTISGSPPPTSAPVIAAAGDVACDPASSSFNGGSGTSSSCKQMKTSDLLVNSDLDAVLALGDLTYECAGATAWQQSYHPSWGRVKGITYPAPGNHEYQKSGGSNCDSTGSGAGYFNYFGSRAGDPKKGYYSFDLGSWHLIALNSSCYKVGGCDAGSPQEKWLRADLASHPNACTLAFFHYPYFSSGPSGGDADMKAFWAALYDYGADVVLAGHDHTYERFAPQTPSAAADPARGIREFVVGTGGKSLFGFSSIIKANSQARTKTYGVLRMVLRPTSYDWEFLAEAGKSFTDTGSTACH